MKKFVFTLFSFSIIFSFLFITGCQGNANLLIEENAKISVQIVWPKLIMAETTDIAIFISNDTMQSYRKAIMVNREQGSQTVDWSLYPGDYTITVLAMQYISSTSSGLKNFTILTGDVQKVSLSAGDNKNLSITLGYINITSTLSFENGQVFHINEPIPIAFNVGLFCSVLKYSSGKLYMTYNNGFKNVTEYRTIYVSNTQEVGNGCFSSKVYPDSNGFPSESMDLSVYAKFTVSSDKIATDFMDTYQINEIKVEISNYSLGHVTDGTGVGSLSIVIQ